jgi:NADH-quinone oxidoreductase subunit A
MYNGLKRGKVLFYDGLNVFLTQYFPVLLFLGVAAGLSVFLVLLGYLRGTQKPYEEKLSAYECGFRAFSDARSRFDIRFYLVAILFIIFDLEISFLFPWTLVFKEAGWAAFISMMIFIGLLTIGFIYEWKKGALEWE